MDIPRTDWNAAIFHNPSRTPERFELIPPMAQQPMRKLGRNIGVGPGATNESSIRLAERGLHMYLEHGGRRVGPRGTFRGVDYGRIQTAGNASSSSSGNAATRKQTYMEMAGGDYSRYQPQSPVQDYYDWQSTAEHALAANPTIPPQTREAFNKKVADILEGRAEYSPPTPMPKKDVPEAAAAPAKGKPAAGGKGKK